MILTYRVLTTLLYPLFCLLIYLRKILKKEDQKRFKEKIYVSYFDVIKKNNSKLIWFHAASIGELKSIIPLIEQLNLKDTNLKFLITTTTLSSGNLASIALRQFNNVYHRYFPLDVPFLIDKFLLQWKPDKIFLVDSEVWPNLILKAKEYKISIALINARLTSKSFHRWMIFPSVAKRIFDIFDLCLCANSETKNKLEKLKLKNIYFKGNIKLFSKIEDTKSNQVNDKILSKKRFWFAASTHKGEDIFCLKTHLRIKKQFKDIKTIIAPRHIERSNNIKVLSQKLGLNVQILKKNESISENKEIIIVNYFGALQNYFKHAISVFIGKSILSELQHEGGQNPIEAAKHNCKIYHGPYVYNFEEIYEIFKKKNISKQINNHYELSDNLITDLKKSYEKNNKISESIRQLGDQTLVDTMKHINNFIYNDAS